MRRAAGALLLYAWTIAAALAFLAGPARAANETSRGPAPKWIAPAVAWSAADGAKESDDGVADVLLDDQIRVGKSLDHYVHRVRRATSRAGVEKLGQIELSVDPS